MAKGVAADPMCGIAGMFGDPDRALLDAMLRRLTHRGPDDSRSMVLSEVGLGTTRLSLLDFEGGAQPATRCGLALAYNGEIYNHTKLREALSREGERFVGRSDTETLLTALVRDGLACVERLEGMFAFAATDGGRLVLARDAFGIKPLFYALTDGGRRLVFASEVKALLPDPRVSRALDRTALVETRIFGHLLGGGSLFRSVRQVAPGSILEISRGEDGRLVLRESRHGAPRRIEVPEEEDACTAELVARLEASVHGQLAADHDIGAYLSGGVDSAMIAALMRRHVRGSFHTFAIADHPESEDLAMARRVAAALGAEHHEIVLSTETLIDALPSSICARETPSPPSIMQATSGMLRRHVKAALSGDGADELFAGYAVHVSPERWLALIVDGYNRLVRGGVRSIDCGTSKAALRALQRADIPLRDAVYAFFLSGQLTERHLLMCDRESMSGGLEVRVPYLDRSVGDFARSLAWSQRVRGDESKVLLRRAALQVLPPAIAHDVIGRKKVAARSAVRRTAAVVEHLASSLVPSDGHPLSGLMASPGQRWLFDLFVLLMVGRGGGQIEDVRPRALYTVHRDELEAALRVAMS